MMPRAVQWSLGKGQTSDYCIQPNAISLLNPSSSHMEKQQQSFDQRYSTTLFCWSFDYHLLSL